MRNRIVRAGFERMVKARPASLYSAAVAERITLGNFADDFARDRRGGLDHRGDYRATGAEAGADGPHRGGAQAGQHRHLEHLRHPAPSDRGGALRGVPPPLPRHPFLQPAALHETAGDHPDRRHRPGGRPADARLRGAGARQGDGALQGHAELHRQPDRHLQRHDRDALRLRSRLLDRGSGRAHRAADRADRRPPPSASPTSRAWTSWSMSPRTSTTSCRTTNRATNTACRSR